MYNVPKYRFILDVNGTETVVYPLYKDDISKELEKEGGNEFFRSKWTGKLVFVKRDYDLINDAAFDTIFKLNIFLRNYTTGIYELDFAGGFVKTDLDFFNGDGIPEKIELKKLISYDRYKSVLEGLENEYNLIELMPDISTMNYINKPMYQFYITGSRHVLNVVGGTYWEHEVDPTVDEDYLADDCFFLGVTITIPEEQKYFVRVLHNNDLIASNPAWTYPSNTIKDNDLVGRDAMGYLYTVTGAAFNPINGVFLSYSVQDDPSEYGKVSTGCINQNKYFSQEIDKVIFNTNAIPLNKALWGCFSIWVNYGSFRKMFLNDPVFNFDEALNKRFVYPYTYKISEVIRVLLNELNPDIIHENKPEYSEFLYSNNVNNIISGDQYEILITPKTNFLTKNADQPATRSILTLREMLDALRDSHKLHWYIDEDNKFRIEYVDWFDNGGSYTGSPIVQIDLTTYISPNTMKPWDFQQNNIRYDKVSMPERYQFAWMESVSPAFEGQPIQILSNYVELGRNEDITVNKFTTDVEYMIGNTGDITKEGYVMFAGIVAGDENELSGTDSDMDGANNWQCLGCDQFDVNNTYPGKMYVKILAINWYLANAFIEPNLYGGNYQAGVSYRISFKCKKIGAADQTLGIYSQGTIYTPTPLTFQPTEIEEEYVFENVVSSSHIFIIKSFSAILDAEFTIDDVVIKQTDSFEMPLKSFIINNFQYDLQNSDLAWYFLHEKFWKYSLPAPNIIVNGVQTTAETLAKGKEQEISFPYLTDPNELELIKTSVGNGEIKKLSINLSSRMIKATLKYDTE